MLNRPLNAVIVRLAIVAASLALLMLVAPVAFADSHTAIVYAENGTDPVAQFQATDEDGDPIEWSLNGDDKDLFEISDDGELSFKSPPSFEAKGDDNSDNVYEVTVKASGGELMLEVTVTDVEEEGSVTLSQVQPQAEIGVLAEVSDPDGSESATTWQWAKSSDMSDWADIEGATGAIYTPAAADIGSYLRATASYTDNRGPDKTASMVSEYDVEPETTANAEPNFPEEDSDPEADGKEDGSTTTPFLRSIDENTEGMNVGNPVAAADADNDVLLYKLGGTDEASFKIDDRSGQITAKVDLNFEAAADVDGTDGAPGTADDNMYEVTVTATDPSLAPMMVYVRITVMDVNEAPTFDADNNPKVWTVNEDDDDVDTQTNLEAEDEEDRTQTTYDTSDEDSTSGTPDTVTLTVGGPDKDAVGEGKAFTFTGTPGSDYTLAVGDATEIDYESQKEYAITIVATDSNTAAPDRTSMTKSIDVKIKVNNLEEAGMVSLSQVQLQQGVPVTATLSDPDGGVSGLRWQWSAQSATDATTCPDAEDPNASDANTGWRAIKGATSATYTPLASHADPDPDSTTEQPMCLQATASYLDAVENTTAADDEQTFIDDRKDVANESGTPVEAKTTGNAAPTFGKEDANDDLTEEDGSADNPFMRNVDENDEDAAVGSPLGSADEDGDDLIHTIGGPDEASFSIASGDGQISVKGELDYETKSMYMVAVTATAPSIAEAQAQAYAAVDAIDWPGGFCRRDIAWRVVGG